jgi:hypothetical protein
LSQRAAPPTFLKKSFFRALVDSVNPITLPDGRQLLTLSDAADYITALPKQESALPEWRAAIEALMLVVEL